MDHITNTQKLGHSPRSGQSPKGSASRRSVLIGIAFREGLHLPGLHVLSTASRRTFGVIKAFPEDP